VTGRSYAGFLRTQSGKPFRNLIPGVGITNTTPLRPNFGSLFTFLNLFQKKNDADDNGDIQV
jgi:hypothetical protein